MIDFHLCYKRFPSNDLNVTYLCWWISMRLMYSYWSLVTSSNLVTLLHTWHRSCWTNFTPVFFTIFLNIFTIFFFWTAVCTWMHTAVQVPIFCEWFQFVQVPIFLLWLQCVTITDLSWIRSMRTCTDLSWATFPQ